VANSRRVLVCAIWRVMSGAGLLCCRVAAEADLIFGRDRIDLDAVDIDSRTPIKLPGTTPLVALEACGLWQSTHSTCRDCATAGSIGSCTPVVLATGWIYALPVNSV